MKARDVHAVLAAGVRRPDLIVHWQEQPESLRRHGVEPEALDLRALRKFTGLTLKVRHNNIRRQLTMSFRLMSHAGFEIELFAAYALYCAENDLTLATAAEDRIHDLVAFADRWLDRRTHAHTLFWDLIRHEQALALLAKPGVSPPPPAPGAEPTGCREDAPNEASIPRIRGRLILHRMRSDPRDVAAELAKRDPRLPRATRAPRYHGYWRAPTDEIQLLELDASGYYALTLVDGGRTAADISRQLLGRAAADDHVLRLLQQLANAGLLEFTRAHASATP